jgi:hypothetical protein
MNLGSGCFLLLRSRRVSGLLICLAALILLLTTPIIAQTRSDSTRPTKPGAPENSGQGIEINGALSESTVPKGQEIEFLVSISNHSPKPVFSLQLEQLFKEGLTVAATSWCDVTKLSNADNSPGPQALACGPIVPRLEPGQSILVSGRLSARAEHQKERVIASLTWDDGHTTSHSFTPLGELVIQSGWDQWRSSAGYDLVKDLTLPVVLLVLATALGFYDKHRENVRHRKQEELEERRKQDAELRAQTAQTWTSMLPESHKLATTYYMPIDAAASSALDELVNRDEALRAHDQPRQSVAEDRAFYYLLLMSRRLHALADKKGGWYFKNRTGEQLVARCLESFRVLFLNNPPEAQIEVELGRGLDWNH